jgi:hypothetical protein
MDIDSLQTYDEEDVTVDATVGGVRLTVAKILDPNGQAKRVTMFNEDAQIRITVKPGAAPTNVAGEIVNPFDRVTLKNASEALNFRAIRTGGTSATLRVKYQR